MATVTGGAQGDAVEFFDGGAKIGSGTLDANGTATYAWTPGTRGAHTLMAKFPGTARANASQSGQQTIDVAQVDTVSSTTIGAVAGAQVGRASTLEATVSPAGAGGTVVFKDGSEVLAQVPVDGAGKATYSGRRRARVAVRSSRSSPVVTAWPGRPAPRPSRWRPSPSATSSRPRRSRTSSERRSVRRKASPHR
ncbi:hypothetical protein GS531_20625 [Rhodococcus hoagii]|nr:hypothetical protein [Prescottella equi]